MKATGIVRRIDDLGRVVIPKEIRRTMRIREGDPLEIYTDADGEVIFKKYSPVGELAGFAGQYAEVLAKATNISIVICDRDRCIAAAGVSKKEALERRISPELEELTLARRSFMRRGDGGELAPLDGSRLTALLALPIIAAGDVCGSVVLISRGGSHTPSDEDVRIAQIAANFLGKQME